MGYIVKLCSSQIIVPIVRKVWEGYKTYNKEVFYKRDD